MERAVVMCLKKIIRVICARMIFFYGSIVGLVELMARLP